MKRVLPLPVFRGEAGKRGEPCGAPANKDRLISEIMRAIKPVTV
jgi:hypothetical protein